MKHKYERVISNPRLTLSDCSVCKLRRTDRSGVFTYIPKGEKELKSEPECIGEEKVIAVRENNYESQFLLNV